MISPLGAGGGARVGVLSAPGEPNWIREGGVGSVSPGGAWIAYGSMEEGAQVWQEINGDRRRQVSTDGGLEPVWCPGRDELFGAPRLASEAHGFVDSPGLSFRVSSDGQRYS